ncbi:MAG: flavin monoamine oxidase family protein [Gammaproteobacteria bacterium]
MNEHHNIAIIGAGLSGLYAAWQLQTRHQDFIVLEARDRTGGRILSAEFNQTCRFDMGPAWVWPHLQPRLNKLINHLNLDVFKQYTTGDTLYEKSSTDIERYSGQSSHNQSYRIAGGAQSLIDALQSTISTSCIQLNSPVQSVNQNDMSVNTIRDGKLFTYTAEKIILALPPRVALQNISFYPPLSDHIIEALNDIPTWMSSHSKIVFIYEKPFWRDQKLSGEVFSQHGPLTEIYDASPATEEYYALTSFVGFNAQQREKLSQDELISACLAQLLRLFGTGSKNVLDIRIKDWSQDNLTTSELDLIGPAKHPQYAIDMPRSFWDDKLILAGTEVAREHGGYLEGALESADEALSLL